MKSAVWVTLHLSCVGSFSILAPHACRHHVQPYITMDASDGDFDGDNIADKLDGATEIAPQQQQKSKSDRFELQFTCNVCEGRNTHSISRHAYEKGTVIVTCPTCNSTHLVADNLNWIEDDFKNLEQVWRRAASNLSTHADPS
jgi:transcription initiation factor IIE alpha subunit